MKLKPLLAICILLTLLICACDLMLQTEKESENSEPDKLIFVGKSKNLNNAQIEAVNSEGSKIINTKLDSIGGMEFPANQQVIIKVKQ